MSLGSLTYCFQTWSHRAGLRERTFFMDKPQACDLWKSLSFKNSNP